MNKAEMLLAAPELLVLVMACVVMCVDVFLREERRGIIHMLAVLTLVFAAIITLRQDAGIPSKEVEYAFNGVFVRDYMGDLLKLFAYGTLALVFTYSKAFLRNNNLFRADFYTLSLFSLLGAMLMISGNSLIMVYLGLELTSLASYALVAFNRDSRDGSEAAMKYFVLGSMASGLLLYGMSMIYGATGTLALPDIAEALATSGTDNLVLVFGMVFLVVGIAFKLGVVPFHMWVPDVYQGAPLAATLFISTVPKLAAFAMAYRLLVSGMAPLHGDWLQMLAFLSVASIIIGNLAAIMQTNIRRMLAYSTISHMGFVLLGMLPGTATGYGASLFYIIVYALMSAAAFGMLILLSGKGHDVQDLDDLKGLNRHNGWFAAIMAMVMFSMAGVPPLVGFFAKWLVIEAVLQAGLTWVAITAVVFSVIGAFYYLRVVKIMYFDEAPGEAVHDGPVDFTAAISLNGLLMLALGLFSGGLITLCVTSFTA
ncbi:NADH-quinone oxidoreductase subunit NuoN [Marinihelvus fidelis]|uniref:NADH-quinone oxidoreductase subunit N n=1 Tax=Marinihelvus fidelis TaxID=2613842 RepID=A0A5N0T5D6_9GAMM|nr:NADH-quinone oxidoreductase subunit NuoN [Marinihelvus fidelis]KAA9130265.1 NADH-quinone oxidoreductase subunit NuoN [Marinihelvus fidelis]